MKKVSRECPPACTANASGSAHHFAGLSFPMSDADAATERNMSVQHVPREWEERLDPNVKVNSCSCI